MTLFHRQSCVLRWPFSQHLFVRTSPSSATTQLFLQPNLLQCNPSTNNNYRVLSSIKTQISMPVIGWERKFRGSYWSRDANHSCNNFLLRTLQETVPWKLWYWCPRNRGIGAYFVYNLRFLLTPTIFAGNIKGYTLSCNVGMPIPISNTSVYSRMHIQWLWFRNVVFTSLMPSPELVFTMYI